MDEEIDRLVISVRADTAAFARDVSSMRHELEGPFTAGVDRVGRLVEASLTRAVSTGKFGFDDLKRVALSAMSEIANASLRDMWGGSSSAGALGSLAGLLGNGGLPGRATGGPVQESRPYLVGERGPEVFVPAMAGRVEPIRSAGPQDVRVNISVQAGGVSEPRALQRSSRQVARAVRSAMLSAR